MTVRLLIGDCRELLRALPDASVNCCVTSPPYFGLRDYGCDGQMGLEPTPDEFVAGMVEVFREVRRVLRDDGTLWLNIGDSYCATPKGNPGERGNINGGKRDGEANDPAAGILDKRRLPGMKQKDLIGIPWLVAIALRADGWYLRQDIIWSKPNPMPESVRDRCTKAHEYLFLLSKSPRYYFDQDAILEPLSQSSVGRLGQNVAEQRGSERVPGKTNGSMKAVGRASGDVYTAQAFADRPQSEPRGCASNFGIFEKRNKRSVWEVTTQPFSEAHFATFPPALIEPCILAGCPEGGTVLDPFGGAGTTGLVADRLRRNAILIELNPAYAAIAERRLHADAGMFADLSCDSGSGAKREDPRSGAEAAGPQSGPNEDSGIAQRLCA